MKVNEKILAALSEGTELKKVLEQALRTENAEDLAILADELKMRGFLSEAEEVYQKLIKDTVVPDAWYLSLADIAVGDDDGMLAFDYLNMIGVGSPFYVQKLVLETEIYQASNFHEVGESKIKEAIGIEPEEILLEFMLAEIYYLGGRFKDAIRIYASLPEDEVYDKMQISLYERIGSACIMEGHFEEAGEFLEKALEKTFVDRPEVLSRLGMAYLQIKDYEKSIKVYQELLELNSQVSSVHALPFAKALLEVKRADEAFEIIKFGIRENPHTVENYLFASRLAFRNSNFLASEDYLLTALDLNEMHDAVVFELLDLYFNQKRFEDAIKIKETLKDNFNGRVEWIVAKSYQELEDYETAIVFYQAAFEYLRENPEFLKGYALFLRIMGDLKRAKKLANKALLMEPSDLELLSLLEEPD